MGAVVTPSGADPSPSGPRPGSPGARRPLVDAAVRADADRRDTVAVIVELADVPAATPLDPSGDANRARATRDRTDRLLARLPEGSVRSTTRFEQSPMVALEVDHTGLDALAADPGVTRVMKNGQKRISLTQSRVKTGATSMWANGTTGAGQTIAVLDTGVNTGHPFLAGKVVAEGCFSSFFAGSVGVCPGGNPGQATGAGSGMPCTAMPDCNHGTHVAGIAVGGAGGTFSGIAPGASLIAVNVFSQLVDPFDCAPFAAPCALAWDADIIRGLDYVYNLRIFFDIAAVNLSLGGGGTNGYCDSDPEKPAIDQLKSAGIVTVAASGNDADLIGKDIIGAPACISSVVSVGATDESNDSVPDWVQTSRYLTLFAPGLPITSSVAQFESGSFTCASPFAGGQCKTYQGTSMASPMVAGAMALVRQLRPGIGIFDAVSLLRNTGVHVRDPGNGISAPRIAMDAILLPPTFHSVTPTRILDTRTGLGQGGVPGVVTGGGSITVQATGLAGIPLNGVSAVALNLTSVTPTGTSFVTAFPAGTLQPLVSNLNLNPLETRANFAVVKVGGGGKITLYNNTGWVHLIADVAGWFDLGGTANVGSRYTGINPQRMLDTRDGTGVSGATSPVGPGQTVSFDASSACAGSGTVRAVTLNITAVAATTTSHVTGWATGGAMPGVSNLNFTPGTNVPNLAIVPVSAGGEVSLFNNSGDVHLIADLQGCYRDGTGSPGSLVSTDPKRLLDTRFGWGGPLGKVAGGSSITLQVAGSGGVPSSGVVAVILNVTVTEPSGASHLTLWPQGDTMPDASNLNFVANQTVPNLVEVRLNGAGQAAIFNNAGATHVIADVFGYVTA